MANGITRREFVKVGAATGVATMVAPGALPAAWAAPAKPRWAMVIDLRRCYGCQACAVACKAEFDVRLGVFKSGVIEREAGRFPKVTRHFLPWLCNHCADPPCVKVCPAPAVEKTFAGETFQARATYQRPDGIVLYDRERCVGCHACVRACPYKARYVEPVLKAGAAPGNNAIGKCTFCDHRVAAGVEPSCVNTCPARARVFGDVNDPAGEVARLVAENKNALAVIHEDFGTKPQVFYLGYDAETYDRGRDVRNDAPAASGQRRQSP